MLPIFSSSTKYPSGIKLGLSLKIFFAILLLIGSLSAFLMPEKVNAGALTNTTLRLDRLASGSPISGLVCARPSTTGAGTEGRIGIQFPSVFTISSSLSNWTTSTNGIPSGTTPWPGVSSNAIQASGTTVTFASGDLTTTNTYCFTFTGTSSSVGSEGKRNGAITTRTGSNMVIDTSLYDITVTDDQLSVSATVPASATDYAADLIQLSGPTQFSQNQTAEYQLTYGSSLSYPSTITVEASWSQATGGIDVLDYVIGSATNAYSGTAPVINTTNRTISWTIPSFPATTTQTVRFTLATNDAYRGSSTLSFQIQGRVIGTGAATPFSTIASTYQYSIPPVPATPTPGPQATADPGSITPAPTSSPSQFLYEDISISSITASSAAISVTTNQPATMTVIYGFKPSSMNQRLRSISKSAVQSFAFPNLAPNTQYYFRVVATNDGGSQITSDIFTFTTAKSAFTAEIDLKSLIITSGNNIIFIPSFRQYTGDKNFIIVPPGKNFELQFGMDEALDIKSIQLIIRPKQVLGASTFLSQVYAQEENSPMLEIKPGVFMGRLLGKTIPGYYEVFSRIQDSNGNLVEEKITDMKVSRPFLIQGSDEKPIERAEVTLLLYNEKTQIFEHISSQSLAIQNPIHTDTKGIVNIVLPIGKYRAEITAFGKKPKTVEFTIGILPDEDYPTVTMESSPFNGVDTAAYFISEISDTTNSLLNLATGAVNSKRLLDILGIITVFLFAILSLLALSEKTHVRIRRLPVYFLSLVTIHRGEKGKEHMYRGLILDGLTKQLVQGVDVFITDRAFEKIIFHTKSTREGKFTITLPPKESYLLTLEKVGFHKAECPLHLITKDEVQTFALLGHNQVNTKHIAVTFIKELLAMGFEFFLMALLVVSILLSFSFGLVSVLPFLALAIFNMVFWVLHAIHHNNV